MKRGDQIIWSPSLVLSLLPFLSLAFHLSLWVHLSWLLQSLCFSCCGPELGSRTKATENALESSHPRFQRALQSCLNGRLCESTASYMLGSRQEQSIVLETAMKLIGKSSGHNKWVVYVNEHINASPDTFISQPYAYSGEQYLYLYGTSVSQYTWTELIYISTDKCL